MKIAIGSDHGGYELKQKILAHLKDYEVEDLGTYSEESCDYPDFGAAVARAVAQGKADRGIVCCGTGIGISIAANKIKGIRCAHVTDLFSAKKCREHNDANVLALGGRVTGTEVAIEIVDVFLTTEFEGGRHQKRVDKIMALEEE